MDCVSRHANTILSPTTPNIRVRETCRRSVAISVTKRAAEVSMPAAYMVHLITMIAGAIGNRAIPCRLAGGIACTRRLIRHIIVSSAPPSYKVIHEREQMNAARKPPVEKGEKKKRI